ncbi:MAG: biosynthetic-type acetolactate synthase large subunit [Candidatus Electrothrix sp. AW2]|jgi:acetolactate synthase-1/2/3 large subunit|nr:biosynthetic-type acetolactate synthase large subunit [Candidatus Electrothrix sp. AX1]MCI5117620.1 biosynthetic-type acetolactate synthase large subunit [Candidatus Electrothrix gigas]MCI5135138.1 biosynthetic-type acetolactate synthase large subunit [Candidatus Electrothrix gigas]MCI5180280.1 biosynthetic-type acetolactate synthase large subunit [Candidatus Electrothrix gigas]MCI5182669.1 biosynthetic-type acetolactate synthase large subunit [Candidatus Electrothrix gigas]
MSKITGAQAFIQCLQEEGVDTIFGFPGGVIIDLYDELANTSIKNLLVRHEQGAVHAADGYARASGKTGVALLTSGPGATNGVTGIATAYMDSIPLVVFTGQVPRALIGNDAFQEVDIVGITRPCTKHNYLVSDPEDLVPTIREAFYLASSGRPGPILVDLPKDVIGSLVDFPERQEIRMRTYQPNMEPHPGQIAKACQAFAQAQRPVFYVGGGVILSNASEELTELAEKTQIPVTMTLMGLGGFPGTNPLSTGMLGMHGSYASNMMVAKSDLLIAVGARFDDRITGRLDKFAPDAKVIHIDIDPTSISKNVEVDIPIVADCKQALTAMNAWFNSQQDIDMTALAEQYQPWRDQVNEWNDKHPLSYTEEGDIIKPQYVIETINRLTGGDAIISTEVGQNQMWAAQFYKFNKPRHWLSSGGLGTMGFGLPAAIGAKMAFPDATVIDIAGDGSIQMNIQELATAKQYNTPVKVAILNNNYLGMVRQWQELFYDKRYAGTVMEVTPDFVELAKAYGAAGLRAKTKSDVEPVIKEALAINDRVVIMDFAIKREECVFPMVPAGGATTEMLLV